jgi:hypothetical protein
MRPNPKVAPVSGVPTPHGYEWNSIHTFIDEFGRPL